MTRRCPRTLYLLGHRLVDKILVNLDDTNTGTRLRMCERCFEVESVRSVYRTHVGWSYHPSIPEHQRDGCTP